jgi:TonB family protein
MRTGLALLTLWTLFMAVQAVSASLHAGPTQTAMPAVEPRLFVRVFPIETPGLTAPVAVRLGRMLPPQALAEEAGRVELEITVGVDGRVRDAMVRTSRGGPRVEADAVRAAGNSFFEPGTLDGRPVAVRMPWSLSVSAR